MSTTSLAPAAITLAKLPTTPLEGENVHTEWADGAATISLSPATPAKAVIEFRGVRAIRGFEETEAKNRGAGSSNALIEVKASEWLDEHDEDVADDQRSQVRHFMVRVAGSGGYEVIADSWGLRRAHV